MKKQLLLPVIALAFLLSFCKKDPTPTNGGLPDKIVVDIPSSISGTNSLKSGLQADTGCIAILSLIHI